MATSTKKKFCDNLRVYFQYWDKADGDKIVGYCRKNILKPVKLRKKDVIQCIEGKLNQKMEIINPNLLPRNSRYNKVQLLKK